MAMPGDQNEIRRSSKSNFSQLAKKLVDIDPDLDKLGFWEYKIMVEYLENYCTYQFLGDNLSGS